MTADTKPGSAGNKSPSLHERFPIGLRVRGNFMGVERVGTVDRHLKDGSNPDRQVRIRDDEGCIWWLVGYTIRAVAE